MIGYDRQGMTLRQFAGLLGVLLSAAGLIALLSSVSGDYDAGMFGDQSVDCGSALSPNLDQYSGDPLEACQDALPTRRAWTWPLFLAGLVVVAGAAVVKTQPAPRSQPATPDGADTST